MSLIIEKAEMFVLELFKEQLPNTFIYHDFTHTKRVYKSTKEIIENSEINVNEEEILLLAALFHDTGYIKTREGHEEESVKIATAFLTTEKIDQDIIDAVNECIMATKFKEVPNSKLGEIIRDADSSHFAKKYFNEASEFLRKEYEVQGIKTYTAKEWRAENIEVLTEKHRYYSPYAIKNWQPEKDKNIAKLMKKKKKNKFKDNKEKLKAKYKAQYKNESPERAIQSFYRTTLKNHIKLSDIADTKANILLSVNAIIISVVLANLISKLDTNPYLTWPTVIFTLFSVISMVMSIIATRPNVTSGQFTKEDVINKEVNLTFFGNFHKMELKEFEWAINEMLKDKDYVYSALTKDLYFLGKVLERKYKILRVTYTIFMIGIIASLIAFGIAVKNNPGVNLDDVLDTSSQIQSTQSNAVNKDTFLVNF
ncbi:Pycsar system effector family protein [Lacinutrix mariniflava]|uniref:Pycsar system effector family protein n=1 Tax=Lacinutrix mariniflava TaxID=342955 RepID=UPI0006E2C23A|nr:Pycsar system effector family protein [Lacinutrix mariniflava]